MNTEDFFDDVQSKVEAAGFFARMSHFGPGFPYIRVYERLDDQGAHGTGFWMLEHQGQRFLGSYGYSVWIIPPELDPSELAVDFLRLPGTFVNPPRDFRESRNLHDLDYRDFLRMFGIEFPIPKRPDGG